MSDGCWQSGLTWKSKTSTAAIFLLRARCKHNRVCPSKCVLGTDAMPDATIHRKKSQQLDTRTRTGTERTFFSWQRPDEVSMGNHDTVEELGSLVQQAQQKAGTKSKRGSGNCAESRSQLFANAVANFFRDKPSTMLHSEGTLSNHGQQPRAGICAQV